MNKDKLYKVEFIDGEDVARFDGELSTDEWWENKCGIVGELYEGDNYIMYDDTLYIKGEITVTKVLEAIGQYHPAREKYDMISNRGYGQEQAYTTSSILGNKDAYVVKDPASFSGTKILPLSRFKKDFPKYNKREYKRLMDSLDKYYEDMRKGSNT